MPTTRAFRALAFDFALTADDPALVDHLDWTFAAFPDASGPVSTYVIDCEERDDAVHVVARDARDGRSVVDARDGWSFLRSLVQWCNAQAVDERTMVALHAGGVVRDGIACVLPASPESGKTTLTAGLVVRGFEYLTDEAVVLADDGATTPYPKPLSVDRGSQSLFPELEPPAAPGLPQLGPEVGDRQWQVPVASVGKGIVAQAGCRAGFVVFPKYDQRARTSLVTMTRGEALVELAKNTFGFRDRGRDALDVLAVVARGAECFRLAVGDLDSACAAIEELFGDG